MGEIAAFDFLGLNFYHRACGLGFADRGIGYFRISFVNILNRHGVCASSLEHRHHDDAHLTSFDPLPNCALCSHSIRGVHERPILEGSSVQAGICRETNRRFAGIMSRTQLLSAA